MGRVIVEEPEDPTAAPSPLIEKVKKRIADRERATDSYSKKEVERKPTEPGVVVRGKGKFTRHQLKERQRRDAEGAAGLANMWSWRTEKALHGGDPRRVDDEATIAMLRALARVNAKVLESVGERDRMMVELVDEWDVSLGVIGKYVGMSRQGVDQRVRRVKKRMEM